MKYFTGNPRKIIQKKKEEMKTKNTLLEKILDLEWHPETHHQQTIIRGKANAVNDYGTKNHIVV